MDLNEVGRAQTMQNMLQYKMQEKTDLIIEGIIVEGEYRQGMNDPSRAAAQWEKVKGIRKIVGRKAIIDEYMHRVKNMKDNKLNGRF